MTDDTIKSNESVNKSVIFEVSEVKAVAGYFDRINDGFSEMASNGVDEYKIESMKDQISMGYTPPEMRIGTDLKGTVPESMTFKDYKEVGTIRGVSGVNSDKGQDMTALGFGDNFSRHLGIDTSNMHYVKGEDGQKHNFKEALSDKMTPEFRNEVSSVYIMQDYNKNDRSQTDFTVDVDLRTGEIGKLQLPYQDIRITSFIFEKYDGNYDVAVCYTNESGYKLGDMSGMDVEGFSWDGKLDCIDDFKDRVYDLGYNYEDLGQQVENYAKTKAVETKQKVVKEQLDKNEGYKEQREGMLDAYKGRYEASKQVYNILSARFSEMGAVLSEKKSEILGARDKCVEAEKNGDKEEIASAKAEFADKIKDYLDTRKEFSKELSIETMTEVKDIYVSSKDVYLKANEFESRVYGDTAKDMKNEDGPYNLDNRFMYATDTTRGFLVIESGTSGSAERLNDKDLTAAIEKGSDYLESKVSEWNEAHPENNLTMDEDGIVRDKDGNEHLTFYNEDFDYSDREDFFEPVNLDSFRLGAFEFSGVKELLEDVFRENDIDTNINDYERTILDTLGGTDSPIDDAEEQNSNRVSLVEQLTGVKSEKDLYKTDSHIDKNGEIGLSAKKINEIRTEVCKEFGIDADKYMSRREELKGETQLSSDEMNKVKADTLKDMKGNFKDYNTKHDILVRNAQDKMNRTEIYARLGVDINKVDKLIMEKISDIKLSDKQMEDIDKQAKFESKNNPEKYDEIKQELIKERKELFAEGLARKELKIDGETYGKIKAELRAETVLPDSVMEKIDSSCRSIAGYKEEEYKNKLERNIDNALDDKISPILNREFNVDAKAFEAKLKEKVDTANAELEKVVEKINKLNKELDKWSDFGKLNGTNLVYNVTKRELHEFVNKYIEKGGAYGDGCFVRSRYKMVESFADSMNIIRSNIFETAFFIILEKIQERIDKGYEKIDAESKVVGRVERGNGGNPTDFHGGGTGGPVSKDGKTDTDNKKTDNKDTEKNVESVTSRFRAVFDDIKDRIAREISGFGTSEERASNDDAEMSSDSVETDTDEAIISDEDDTDNDSPAEDDTSGMEDNPTDGKIEDTDSEDDVDSSDSENKVDKEDEEDKDEVDKKEEDEEEEDRVEKDKDDAAAVENEEEIEADKEEDTDRDGLEDKDDDKASDDEKDDEERIDKEQDKEDEPDKDDKIEQDEDEKDELENREDSDLENDEEESDKSVEVSPEELAAEEDIEAEKEMDTEKDGTDVTEAKNDDAVVIEETGVSDTAAEPSDSVDTADKARDIDEENSRPIDESEDETEKSNSVSELKDILKDYFDEKDSLSDNLDSFFSGDIENLKPFDLVDAFADVIFENINRLSAEDIADAFDMVSDHIYNDFGELGSNLSDRFFDDMGGKGIDDNMMSELDMAFTDAAMDKVIPVEYEGYIGAADLSPDGSSLDNIPDSSLNDIENRIIDDFTKPENMEALMRDVDLSDKIDSIANYIYDTEGGSPDGGLTMNDCNNIANDIVRDALRDGSITMDTDGTEIGDYWPDDSSFREHINYYQNQQMNDNVDTKQPNDIDMPMDTGTEAQNNTNVDAKQPDNIDMPMDTGTEAQNNNNFNDIDSGAGGIDGAEAIGG